MQLKRVIVTMVLVAGCSSVSVSSGGGSGGGSAGSAGTGGTAIPESEPSDECPVTIPLTNTLCSVERTCDYGNAAELECNERATCTRQFWERVPSTGQCQRCPEKRSAITEGAECTIATPKHPFVCTYYEGMCGCVPDAQDAGADAGPATTGRWRCMTPDEGCPARRPIPNASCVRPMECDYGSCLFVASLAFRCTGLVWERVPPSCP